jgi:peroxiredoxin
MLRKLSTFQALLLAVLVLFTVFITWRAKKIERALAMHDSTASLRGKNAPAFTLDSLEGRKISLAEFHGKKKVVISYWASWCGPCKVELPELKRFYEKYHKDDSEFEILAISIDDDRESAESFANKAKIPFPILLDLNHEAADAYSVEAIPAMFIVDKQGVVSYATTGLEQSMEVQLAMQLGISMDTILKQQKNTGENAEE